MRIKRGDTKPDLVIDLTDNGLPLSLATAGSIRVIGRLNETTLFNDTAPTVNALNGVVTHRWLPAQTANTGRVLVEVEVTWGDLSVQTFPEVGYLLVQIDPDLG